MKTNSTESKKQKLNKLLSIIFVVLVVGVVVIYFLLIPKQSHYEKSISLIHEKKYSEAIELLQSMSNDTGITNHFDITAKLNFCNAMNYLNSSNYDSADYYLNLIPKIDTLYNDSKKTLDSLYKIPEFVYKKGMFYLENKSGLKRADELESAFDMFSKITNLSSLYTKAQNKINYITGIKYYSDNNYDNAKYYLQQVNINDDYYNKSKEFLMKIDRDVKLIANKAYYDHIYELFHKLDYRNNDILYSVNEELNEMPGSSSSRLSKLRFLLIKHITASIQSNESEYRLNHTNVFYQTYSMINECHRLEDESKNSQKKFIDLFNDIKKNGY